ncbi:MAG: MFS transporter [Vulcanimicrobiaceae bacterium]
MRYTSQAMLPGGQRRGVFNSPAFARYFLGQALSYIGDGLRLLAVPLLVFHLTGSALTTGGSLIAEVAPFAIFAMVGGSLADRVDRRRLMILCDMVRFAVMAAFTITYALHVLTVPMIYGGLAIISISAAFFMGGQSASIPYLVGKEGATRATSALLAAENSSNLVTPIVGGALFSFFGPLPALAINALTYLGSQISLAFVPSLGPDTPKGVPTWSELRGDLKIGMLHLLRDRAMRAQTMVGFALNTLGYAGYAILIPFFKRDFGASDRDIGIIFGINALGALVGSLAAGHLDRRWPFGRAITIAYVIDALLFLPVIFVKSMWLAGFCWAASNALAQFEVGQIIGWRLRILPNELVGRVFGAVRLFVLIGMAPGVLLAGWVADRYGAHPAMAISAIGYVVIAFVALASPTIRREAR